MRRVATLATVVSLLLAASIASAKSGEGGSDTATSSAAAVCPFSFHVLHNDHIGRLSLPGGQYRITVINGARLSCKAASNLFTNFLEDFDGVLPRPWFVNVAKALFRRGPGSAVGFRVRRIGPSGGGGGNHVHPDSGHFCPGTFSVLHNDRIGQLRLPKGPYWITLLQDDGLSCSQASKLFSRFLDDPQGDLPRPWLLYAAKAQFRRGPGGVGFRVKPAT